MTIEFDDGGWRPIDEAKKLEEQLRRHFGQVMSDTVAEMVLRIRSGRDVNNAQMRAYSPGYAEYKAKKGRRVSPPDMTFTGLMLASIAQRVSPKGNGVLEGVIYFANPVAAERAQGNINNRRDFFGLTKEQEDGIYNRLQELINL